jgi:hypothetical protein
MMVRSGRRISSRKASRGGGEGEERKGEEGGWESEEGVREREDEGGFLGLNDEIRMTNDESNSNVQMTE